MNQDIFVSVTGTFQASVVRSISKYVTFLLRCNSPVDIEAIRHHPGPRSPLSGTFDQQQESFISHIVYMQHYDRVTIMSTYQDMIMLSCQLNSEKS